MQYTIYMNNHDGKTLDEKSWFEEIFRERITFLSEKIVDAALPSGIYNGINLIPGRDSIRIIEISRIEKIRREDETIECRSVKTWNDNPGSIMTGRIVCADVYGKSQGCFLLKNVHSFTMETEDI